MSDAIPSRVRELPEFPKFDAYSSATYVIDEVDGVLRLTKEKARKSPEERAGLSQPGELRLDVMTPTLTLTAGTLILCFASANYCAAGAPNRRGFSKNPAAFRRKSALPPDRDRGFGGPLFLTRPRGFCLRRSSLPPSRTASGTGEGPCDGHAVAGGGGIVCRLNSCSNSPTTRRISSKVGTSPKNIGPSISW